MKKYFKYILIFVVVFSKSIFAEIINIDPIEITKLMSYNIPLIDIRREDEWKSTGIVKNSHLHTFFDKSGRYDFKKFLENINKIDNIEIGIILICTSGVRTTIIANALEKTGKYNKIYNTKGIKDWISENNKLIVYK